MALDLLQLVQGLYREPNMLQPLNRPTPSVIALLAALIASPAGAGRSEEPDYRQGLAQASYSADGQPQYGFIAFDAVAASVNRTAVELTLNTPDSQLLLFARSLIDIDPWAHLTLSASNPFASEAKVTVTLSMPTTRLIDSQWQAVARLGVNLTDGNGDGARAAPAAMIFSDDPLAPPLARFMDTGVALRIGLLNYFGGPPVAPLGDAVLVAAPGASASFEARASAPALPSHAWIGPDVAWNTMSMQLSFTLSPGDQLTLQADLDILPVPEPATAWLLLAGGVGLAAWLRHRPHAPLRA